MPLQDDVSIPHDAMLYRVLPKPSWIKTEGETRRPSSIAFYEARGEVSYFVDGPGMLAEVRRIFPGMEIARVPASVLRSTEVGFVIERRPADCPEDFHCDPANHVVAGPSAEITRNEFQRRARRVAKHTDVTIVPQEPPTESEPTAPPLT